MLAATFIAILISFVMVGFLAIRRNTKTVEDYLVAGRSINPWFVGLAAIATGHSGFKFIGLIGFAYLYGLPAIWITIGWMCGDALAWYSGIPSRLRQISGEKNLLTYSAFLAGFKEKPDRAVAWISGIISFVFLSSYAAAQFAAGGKSLQVLLHWDYNYGLYISASIVTAYCIFGGIRASIWTEVPQSLVMLSGMYLLAGMTIWQNGGLWQLFTNLAAIDPSLATLFPGDSFIAFVFLFISLAISGFGVIGQPHVMVKSMTVDSPKNVALVRKIYVWLGYTLSFGGLIVGMGARVLLPMNTGFDPETIMPVMAQQFFHPILAGVLLAALFSATISTAGSQILVCSATLASDMMPRFAGSVRIMRTATFCVTAVVFIIAHNFSRVFDLVMFSWAALASAFAPLVILRVSGRSLTTVSAVATMLAGVITAISWRLWGYPKAIYETMPGVLIALATYRLLATKEVTQLGSVQKTQHISNF